MWTEQDWGTNKLKAHVKYLTHRMNTAIKTPTIKKGYAAAIKEINGAIIKIEAISRMKPDAKQPNLRRRLIRHIIKELAWSLTTIKAEVNQIVNTKLNNGKT